MLMFKQIVSKLSLSPSAVSELAFYARRLKQEKITRTFSAIAAALVIGLQFLTITAPPTASNAASPSDLIHGGIVSKDDLLNHYDAPGDLKAIYNYFGISRADLASTATKEVTINTRDKSLQSLSRVAHSASDGTMIISGVTYYYRPMYKADTGANIAGGSDYKVLQGYSTATHSYFAVMFVCGNIVFKTIPKPPATPTPTPKPTPKPTPPPVTDKLACTGLDATPDRGIAPLKVAFSGTGSVTGQTITSYIFDFGDNNGATLATGVTSHTYAAAGVYTATLRVKGSKGTTTAITPICTATLTVTPPPAAFTKSKTALNLTQNIDATTGPAHAGDSIRYSLVTKNIGGVTAPYAVVEHVSDILEYADITDATGATLSDGILTWPAVAIAAGKSLVTTFTITVGKVDASGQRIIPATPVGVSDKYSFDLRMDNVYGDSTVQVSITPPPAKQIETISKQMPDTGAASSTIIVLLFTGLALFFFFRNRQLLTEIKVLRNEYHGGV